MIYELHFQDLLLLLTLVLLDSDQPFLNLPIKELEVDHFSFKIQPIQLVQFKITAEIFRYLSLGLQAQLALGAI